MTATARPIKTATPAAQAPSTSKVNKTVKWLLWRTWLPITLFLLWWFASAGSESLYFPPLQEILASFRDEWLGAGFMRDLVPSLGKFLAGFTLSGVIGISLGVILGMNKWLRAAFEPLIMFMRSVPGPVLVPIGILLIGIGAGMNVFIIVLGAVWPTLLGTIDGVRALDPQLRDVVRSYRLTTKQYIFNVILPNAGPQIFAGLRTTLQLSIILIVVSEMVASTNGVGFRLLLSQQTFSVTETWSGTLLLGILGYLAAIIFIQVEKKVLAWQQGMLASTEKG